MRKCSGQVIMGIHEFLTDFNLDIPDIKGRDIHAIGVHIGWLNWGSVGDESLEKLIEHYDAEKIAEFTTLSKKEIDEL